VAYDNEFIIKLIGFGLTGKETQLYFHLLKYGPKSASFLAKSFKTYREAIHRMLAGVIDEGTVDPSLESLAIYSAVDLDMALVERSRCTRMNCVKWKRESRSCKNYQSNRTLSQVKSSPRLKL